LDIDPLVERQVDALRKELIIVVLCEDVHSKRVGCVEPEGEGVFYVEQVVVFAAYERVFCISVVAKILQPD
jgi:hypothetical protein